MNATTASVDWLHNPCPMMHIPVSVQTDLPSRGSPIDDPELMARHRDLGVELHALNNRSIPVSWD